MNMPFDALGDLSDEALLALYASGDRAAAAALSSRLTPLAYRLAARMLGDLAEAEDVAQEALLRLWKIAPDWRAGEAKISTWLYRVTSNLCLDRLRKRPNIALDTVAEPLDEGPSVEANLMVKSRTDALNNALLALPDRQRQAVILRHLEDCANPQIAEAMDLSVEAVESLIARGKRRLSEILRLQKAELGFEE